jgi:molybdopterin-containing oxidoreductase family iron-sulfur binding subunit
MGTNRKYWKGIEELKNTPEFQETIDKEFAKEISVEEFLGDDNLMDTSTNRRDFMKFLGFSVAAASLAACEAPVTKAIPYVNKPENVTPGMPTWYASTYYDGNSYASILVKTREGRPIYIKGNADYGISNGAVNAQIIASVLGLYEGERLQGAKAGDNDKSWSEVDSSIKKELAAIAAKKGKIVLVSNTIISPTTQSAIAALDSSLGGTVEMPAVEHIQYDAISYAGIRQANLASFGLNVIPDYNFAAAKTIVSIGADFIGSWLLANQYQSEYLQTRNPDGEWMSRHFQFESVMSLSGTNADYRGIIKPSEQANVIAYLLKGFNVDCGVSTALAADAKKVADEAIKSLKSSKSESVVVCGSNNKSVQILVNKLNTVLGAYAKTININNPVKLFMSEDEKMNKLVADVIAGKGPDAVLFAGANPVYTLANGKQFGAALSKLKLTVSFASLADETATLCKFICPDHHALESWNDYNPKLNHYSIAQPTIRPLHNTASFTETLLVWAGKAARGGKDSKVVYDAMRANWELNAFPAQTKYSDFHTYWSMAVHNSCDVMPAVSATAPLFIEGALAGAASHLPKGGEIEIVLYQKLGIGNGEQANNPWLQELPDPISKVTWDNYITMNPAEMGTTYATTFDQESGLNVATVKVGSSEVTLPVYPSPGQALKTVGIALGYGRGASGERIGKAAFQTKEYGGNVTNDNGNRKPIGENVYPFSKFENGSFTYNTSGSITKVNGVVYPIAATQIHHTVMGRYSIVRETTLETYTTKNRTAFNPLNQVSIMDEHGEHVALPVGEADLWEAHPVEHIGHRWGMTIDLSSCIGCGSCLVSCQAENNVPVVGKDEVRRGREMHWIRIDRYYASDEEVAVGTRGDKETFDYHKAEVAAVNPKVVHMPMLCHHCNHAPCETVCPVAATNHSNEGLNQMAYNRCIGTRYCANNCPYKVRRFNWFNYPSYKKFTEVNPAQDDLGRMVLNPDVTVRTRGVMEKCSFCVQRIQATKLEAKKDGTPVQDGSLATACSEACPTNAIIVGDWNDVKSHVRKSSQDLRAYQALEEVGTKPNIWYKVKVRNEHNPALNELQKEVVAHHGAETKGHGEKKSHH